MDEGRQNESSCRTQPLPSQSTARPAKVLHDNATATAGNLHHDFGGFFENDRFRSGCRSADKTYVRKWLPYPEPGQGGCYSMGWEIPVAAFHTLSHHREDPQKIEEYAKLNAYHVSKASYFLERLRSTPEGDGNLLDHSVVLYGSPMGDSHVHEHRFLPIFLAGRANGALKGNLHIRCAPSVPLANVLLTLVRKLGVDIDHVGDSSAEVAI